jgi:hypothetical protein
VIYDDRVVTKWPLFAVYSPNRHSRKRFAEHKDKNTEKQVGKGRKEGSDNRAGYGGAKSDQYVAQTQQGVDSDKAANDSEGY